MIFQYSNGSIYSQNLLLCKVVKERSTIKVEGSYNVIIRRKGFSKYEILQYNSKVGEINRLNLTYGTYTFYISRPQLVAFIRGYQDSLKIFTSGNVEVGEIKRTQNGLEGYLNDFYDPYVMIIYLALMSLYATITPYPNYRPKVSRYRGIWFIIPFVLIFVYLLPFPFYIDLAIYIILLAIFYYFLVLRR
ncbi:hypothetical protein [Saccharolobus caldissimus]|uniref:Uncharacterized protein n=1 Tax=Saccharolobus caldissimus TaxID=1702097 RepID=A0AAQ4CQM4_9CREN|nr:hypothetical protein [Saccharolobus caldissimus]BDB98105.1 hypothetical protein SACC_11220 [Saccharolobus caldissimus]